MRWRRAYHAEASNKSIRWQALCTSPTLMQQRTLWLLFKKCETEILLKFIQFFRARFLVSKLFTL